MTSLVVIAIVVVDVRRHIHIGVTALLFQHLIGSTPELLQLLNSIGLINGTQLDVVTLACSNIAGGLFLANDGIERVKEVCSGVTGLVADTSDKDHLINMHTNLGGKESKQLLGYHPLGNPFSGGNTLTPD